MRKKDMDNLDEGQNPDAFSLQELNGYTSQQLAADAKNYGYASNGLLKGLGFPLYGMKFAAIHNLNKKELRLN